MKACIDTDLSYWGDEATDDDVETVVNILQEWAAWDGVSLRVGYALTEYQQDEDGDVDGELWLERHWVPALSEATVRLNYIQEQGR